MTQQTINLGTQPNDGSGSPLRTAFGYCNANFSELYRATGAPPIVYSTAVPAISAGAGTLCINLSGSNATNRAFINLDGATGWTYLIAGT